MYDPIYDGMTFAPLQADGEPGRAGLSGVLPQGQGRAPSGRLWDIYRANLAVDSAMLRTVVLPPGVRRLRSTRCARAIERLNNDPEFAKEAQKSLQFVPQYVTGGDLNARVRRTWWCAPRCGRS